ncbi:hypothetical protein CLU79DRAFT_832818 [Phycomyces nitens]|nr:hypothetical protein CLU79DRAFT_832818 [Phycomyces nitens]
MDVNFDEEFQTMTTTPRTFPCDELTDIQGKKINVRQLANDYHLILITLKNTECKVCPQLLHVLNLYGMDPDCYKYVDPFTHQVLEIDNLRKKFFGLMLLKDAYFIIFCPGSTAEVSKIQQTTCFQRYPFVAGEQAMSLGKALKLNMSDEELWPAILKVSRDTLNVQSICIGREPGNYYQKNLIKRLLSERVRWEMQGIKVIQKARNTIDRLQRRMVKCQEKNLVAGRTLSLLPTPLQVSAPAPPSTDLHQARSPQHLPAEILDLILSFDTNTASLVKVARTSRLFYITVCGILVHRLRSQMNTLWTALPQQNGEPILDEMDAMNPELNRWEESEQGVGFRELERRVESIQALVNDVNYWTKQWVSRRIRAPVNSSSGTPVAVKST